MRRGLPLLLSLLLVCAQGAGLWHGIGHSANPQASPQATLHPGSERTVAAGADAPAASAAALGPQAPEPAGRDDGRCEKCFQFAHFSGGAAPQPAVLPDEKAAHARAVGTQAALVARDAPPTRSRGPPVLL